MSDAFVQVAPDGGGKQLDTELIQTAVGSAINTQRVRATGISQDVLDQIYWTGIQKVANLRAIYANLQNTPASLPPYAITNAEILAGVVPTNLNWPELYLERYGGKADGLTDNAPAFAAANSVMTSKGGGTLYLQATGLTGYNTSGSIILATQGNIEGAGMEATTIQYTGSGTFITFPSVSRSNHVRDLAIKGSAKTGTAIQFGDTNFVGLCRVSRVEFDGWATAIRFAAALWAVVEHCYIHLNTVGIDFNAGGGAVYSSVVDLLDNYITSNDHEGIAASNVPIRNRNITIQGGSIEQNCVADLTRAQFVTGSVQQLTVENVYFEYAAGGTKPDGINVNGAGPFGIRECVFLTLNRGIFGSACDHGKIDTCRFIGSIVNDISLSGGVNINNIEVSLTNLFSAVGNVLAGVNVTAYTGIAVTYDSAGNGTVTIPAPVAGTALTINTVAASNSKGIEVIGSSGSTHLIRVTNSVGYCSTQLRNDLNNNLRALEIDYSCSSYAGTLLTGGNSGEEAAITTTGAFPLEIGTNNTSRVLLPSTGGITVRQPTSGDAVTLPAGTTAIAPLVYTSGTNLTTAAAGKAEFDGTCLYFSPAASSRAVAVSEYIEVITSAYTLTSQTAAQKLLNATTNGAVTLPVGTYEFECCFSLTSLNTGTSSIFGFALGGGATFTQAWWAHAVGAALATASTMQGTFNTAANVAIVAANTSGNGHAIIKGIIRVTVTGTVIPQVSLNTAAAAIVGTNSYFRAWPVGNGTVTNVGNWS